LKSFTQPSATDETLVYDLNRRRHGLVIGLAAGLVYGLVAHGANLALLPGIALYQPPFGWLGNTLLWTVVGGLLGLICAWPSSSIYGVVVASLVAGLMLQISTLLSGHINLNLWRKLIGAAGLYLPFAAMASPLLGLLRGAVNEQREWYQQVWVSWRRLRLPLLFVGVIAGLATLWVYPAEGIDITRRLDALIQLGLEAGKDPAGLPTALKDPLVGAFTEKATPAYQLEFSRQDLNRFQIPYAPQGDFQPAGSIARFSSGWALVCVYVNPIEAPFCRGFDNLESETQ
jgi:hypothetical protein